MPDLTGDRDDHEEPDDDGPFGDWEPSAVPAAPDGGIQPGFALEAPEAAPSMDAEHCVCLRGPCKHFWEIVTPVNAGNPAGTWEALGIPTPRHFHRSCVLTQPEMELKDTVVLECNNWDPVDPLVFRDREYRREQWNKENADDVIDAEETDAAPKE